MKNAALGVGFGVSARGWTERLCMNRKQRNRRIREKQLSKERQKAAAVGSSSGGPDTPVGVGRATHGDKSVPATDRSVPATDKSVPATDPQAQFDWETECCARAMRSASAHNALCKREGIKQRPVAIRYVNSKIAPCRMNWRRISSITFPLEPFMDALERRAGLKRLMGWLEKACLNRTHGGGADTLVGGRETAATTASVDPSHGDKSVPATSAGADLSPTDRNVCPTHSNEKLIHADWNNDLSNWQRVKTDGHSIEAICANLGISRWKLTQLTKEYCNLTATELFDGFKVNQLKTFMFDRLREAARALWGSPGHYAQFKALGYLDCQSPPLESKQAALLRDRKKQSKFFQMKVEDLFNENRGEEKQRRITALIERMWQEFDFESWAVSAGYSSAKRLKRAVLNRMGKTFERLEKCLAAEVIEYYQCVEDRELRALALRNEASSAILKARELYHRSIEKPAEPFMDMWSTALFAAKEWLEKMAGAFG